MANHVTTIGWQGVSFGSALAMAISFNINQVDWLGDPAWPVLLVLRHLLRNFCQLGGKSPWVRATGINDKQAVPCVNDKRQTC